MPTVYYTDGAASQFTSGLIYGLAGAGKTPIAATAPDPIIISSEPGLKSLQHLKLPYVVGRDTKEADDILAWLKGSNETRKFQTVYFDSISALSENVLLAEKKISKDPRKFSPATTAEVIRIVLAYLTIPNKHVWMTCKAIEQIDIENSIRYIEPFAVVPKLGPQLPYHFDNVLYLSRVTDATTGVEQAWFRCRENSLAKARNRTGLLNLWEPANIDYVIKKSSGVIF